MKGHKGGEMKQSQAKGANQGGADRGPLFPRLHVNETEKAGPKAPPRNKMALYEQFTVPSHRLTQASQTPAKHLLCQQQYGMRESGYPYVHYYVPSVPYAHTNHGVPTYAHSTQNTSSSGLTNSNGGANESGGQAASWHNRASKLSVSRHLTENIGNRSAKNIPEPRGRGAPQSQSSLTNQTEEATSSLQNTPSDMERSQITDIAESLHEALRTVEVTTEYTVPDANRLEFSRVGSLIDKSSNSSVAHEGKRKQATQMSIFETMTKPTMGDGSSRVEFSRVGSVIDKSSNSSVAPEGKRKQATQMSKPAMGHGSDKVSVQVRWASESASHECVNDPGMLASTPYVHGNVQPGAAVDLGDKGTVHAGSETLPSFKKHANLGPQLAPTRDGISENNVGKRSTKNSTAGVEKLESRTDAHCQLSLECSDGRPDNVDNRQCEESHPFKSGAQKEGHSDSRSTVLESIKPKDVIRAIGQQQFWKARKKLLQQQRIFSDQVFQLHKLIKVQQLLSETPLTLIDEEMQFESSEEECCAATPPSKTATAYSGDDPNRGSFDTKEQSKGKPPEPECQPRYHLRQTHQADTTAGSGRNKSTPEISPVGVSAWGYPSLGAWGGAMAPQGSPFSYQQFGTTAFGLPFGPSMPRSGAPMMSLGIPFCTRQHEPPAEVDSNYTPGSALKHEGSGFPRVDSNNVSNDQAASWYFAQYNNLSNMRLLAGGLARDVPTGSGASANKSLVNPQAAKTTCFPGLSQNWGLTSQTSPLNSNRQDLSAHQSENSSSSNATRPNGGTSSTPSMPPARWHALMPLNRERGAEMVESSSVHGVHTGSDNSGGRNPAEKEKLRPLSHSKPRTAEAVGMSSVDHPLSSSKGHDHTLDMNHNALDLFPLVPSMGSSREEVWNARAEGQGGVIRAVPRRATAASKSAAGILLSLQQERQK